MDAPQAYWINLLIILFSVLLFVIFLLLSYLYPKERNERLNTLFNNLAFVCVPVFLLGVADRVFLIRYFLNDTERLIQTRVVEPFGRYTGNLEKYGVKGMNPPIDVNVIFNETEAGGTLSILDTLIPDLHKAFPSMRAAFDRGVKVRVLVAHPESLIAKFRSVEIGPEWDYDKAFRPGIYGYISHFQAITSEDNRKRAELLEIRYYEDLPCMPFYIIDNPGENNDKVHQGYFLSSASVEVPNVEIVRTKAGIYRAFEEYFKEKWARNAGNKINLSDFKGPGSLPPPRYVEAK